MTNLDIELGYKPSIHIVKQQETSKGLLPLFSQTYNRGHVLFEINTYSREIEKAVYSQNYWNPIKQVGTRKVLIKPNCIYRQFLNITNARKWVKKNL